MKKVLFSIAIVAMVAASCGNAAKEAEQKKQDSIAAAAKEQARLDSIAAIEKAKQDSITAAAKADSIKAAEEAAASKGKKK
jgi:PBP1b-binding outer membrane lipoprotein LpoB